MQKDNIIKTGLEKFQSLNSRTSVTAETVQRAIEECGLNKYVKAILLFLVAKLLRKKSAYSVILAYFAIGAAWGFTRPCLWEWLIGIVIGKDNTVGAAIISFIQWWDGGVDYIVLGALTIVTVIVVVFNGIVEIHKVRVHKELKTIIEAITFQPSDDWFDKKCELAIETIGERYSPKENFRNPALSNVYKALVSTDYWCKDFKKALRAFLIEANKDYNSLQEEYKESHRSIKTNIDTITDIYNHKLNGRFGEIFALVEQIIESYRDLRYYYEGAYYEYDFDDLKRLSRSLYEYKPLCQFINKRVIYIKGVAGTGKSHLMADIVTERMSQGHKSLLLLGLKFTDMTDIRERIKSILSIKGTWDDFLKNVNEVARIENDRIIFFIDGINEGIGESLWKDNLADLEKDILQYDRLALVVSARTFVKSNMLDDVSKDRATIELNGFKGMEDKAISYLSGKFGVALPNITHHLRDFSNPLFLRLYLKSYDTALPIPKTFLDVVYNYVSLCNKKLATKYKYEPTIYNYVRDAVHCLADLYVGQAGYKDKWKKLKEYLCALSKVLPQSIDTNAFVQDLINDGVFMSYTDSNGDVLLDYNFDLVGDYICAKALIEVNWSQYFGSVLSNGVYESTAVLLPILKGIEIYDYNSTNMNLGSRQEYFLQTLNQRLSLSPSALVTLEFIRINHAEIFYEYSPNIATFEECQDLIDRYNADMKSMSMQDRDSKYGMYFTLGGNGIDESNLCKLAKWALAISRESARGLSDSQSFQIASILCWSFCIPYKPLRNLVTKAVINLLRDKNDVLIRLINLFDDVSDPYIQQRMYAVVHGCVYRGTCENSGNLAKKIYEKVFNVAQVRPDILLKDYARCSIERILQNTTVDIDVAKIRPPYKSTFSIEACPTRSYIEANYRLQDGGAFTREEVNAQNRILSSMETEYSNGTCGYGDFGRYIFESAIDAWEGDIPNFASSVRNYAVDLIFNKYGYNPKIYARHDCHYHRSRGHQNTIERFGKKYQWISMYEVLGLLADNYPMESDVSNDKAITCPGSWNPLVRDIDTTSSYFCTEEEETIRDERLDWTTIDSMPFDIKEPDKWLHSKEGISKEAIKQTIEVSDNSETWVVLHGYNTLIKEDLNIDLDDSDNSLWVFAQAYVCPKSEQKKLWKSIHKNGTQGRRAPEYSNSFYSLYYKDYYSSVSYKDYARLTELEKWETYEGSTATYQISYYPYSSEGDNSIYRLNHLLFDILELSDGERDGEYVDASGKIVAFDPSVNNKNEGQLLVRKQNLVNALKKHNLQLVWPILCEKQKGVGHVGYQIGGVAYYNSRFKLKVKLKIYIEKPIDHKKRAKKEMLKRKALLAWYFVTFQRARFNKARTQLRLYQLYQENGLEAFRNI